MDRRSKLGAVPESQAPKVVEQSPLIDPRRLRSCRSTLASRSAHTNTRSTQRAPSKASHSLKTISELTQPSGTPKASLNRSRSAPLPAHYPNHIRSPQYRANPIVKFSDRPLSERMNYGIAGYNTSRPRSFTSTTRPRSFPESPQRPRSLSSVPAEPKGRPRSFTSIPESPLRAPRSALWRSWTRRFRDKMGRVRVRDTCSKLLSRFRGDHL